MTTKLIPAIRNEDDTIVCPICKANGRGNVEVKACGNEGEPVYWCPDPNCQVFLSAPPLCDPNCHLFWEGGVNCGECTMKDESAMFDKEVDKQIKGA
jgi:hypothetical protein